jgi:putative ABC transport system permease protein
MSLNTKFRMWVRDLFRASQSEHELEAELRFDLAQRIEANVRSGMSRQTAEIEAQREFGSVALAKEECRDERPTRWFEDLWQDVRFGLRMLRKNRGFTAIAILTLALGIGANTAIFSVVNAVLIRPLPFSRPDRLVRIFETNDKLHLSQFSSSVPNYLSWKEQAQSFDQMGIIGFVSLNLTGTGDPEQFNATSISPSLMPLLGLQPVIGRAFREDEEKVGSAPVVMLSEGLWKRRFGGDPALIGKTITLSGTAYTVVGITPAALAVLTTSDINVPLTLDLTQEKRLNHQTVAVARLKPGVTLAQAQSEMNAVSHRVGQQFPEVKDWGVELSTFSRWIVGDQLRTVLIVLLCSVMFVLLIACANMANLLLARAAGRQQEIVVRLALGAGRRRLIRQLLTESSLLSLLGGFAGVFAAYWVVRALGTSLPAGLLPISDVHVDSSVMIFALAISLCTGILFGLAPALQTAKSDLNSVLKQGGRSGSSGARPVLRKALIASELALATVLLVGAGLLMQSLFRMQAVTLGYQPEHLLTFQLSPPTGRYAGTAKTWTFYKSLIDSLQSIPGVRGAAVSSGLPFGGGSYTRTPMAPLGPSKLPVGDAIPIDWRTVSPGYFKTMEIPLLRGRLFDEHDDSNSAPVMVVSQQTADTLWGADDPLGKVIRIVGSGKQMTVVGVVGDVRNTALNQDPVAATYISAAYRQLPLMDVVVRTEGNPNGAIAGVRQKLRELDSDLPMASVRSMQEWISTSAAQPRLNSALLEVFSVVALLIAAIGIYGVLSYSVNQRTREIGVRVALGAQRGDVVRLVAREGMMIALAGIGAGLVAAFAISRVIASLLYGIQAHDLTTFAGVAVVLLFVAAIACYVPAIRATRIDPIVALRYE